MKKEYIPIQVASFRSNVPLTFDLFLKVNEKFILYIKEGDDIDEHRLSNLRKMQVKRIFIQSKKLESYYIFISQVINNFVEDADRPEEEEKAELMNAAASTAVEIMQQNPTEQESYEINKEVGRGLATLVKKNPKVIAKIFRLRGSERAYLVDHCKNVAALASSFANFLGISGADLENIGTAGLLHDLGLIKITADELDIIFYRKPKIYTPEDKRIYRLHVADSVQLLQGKSYVNPDVLSLVAHHEERISGEGYPNGKKDLSDLQQILSIIDTFDRRVNAFGMSDFNAAQEILIEEVGNFSLELLKSFKKFIEATGIV